MYIDESEIEHFGDQTENLSYYKCIIACTQIVENMEKKIRLFLSSQLKVEKTGCAKMAHSNSEYMAIQERWLLSKVDRVKFNLMEQSDKNEKNKA